MTSDGLLGPGFVLPWDSIDRLAEATGIPRDAARLLAEAEAREWAANASAPTHLSAYLRTLFAAQRRDADRGLRARADGRGRAAIHAREEAPGPLSEARQLALVAAFYQDAEWSPKVRGLLGPAPDEPGCRIAAPILARRPLPAMVHLRRPRRHGSNSLFAAHHGTPSRIFSPA